MKAFTICAVLFGFVSTSGMTADDFEKLKPGQRVRFTCTQKQKRPYNFGCKFGYNINAWDCCVAEMTTRDGKLYAKVNFTFLGRHTAYVNNPNHVECVSDSQPRKSLAKPYGRMVKRFPK